MLVLSSRNNSKISYIIKTEVLKKVNKNTKARVSVSNSNSKFMISIEIEVDMRSFSFWSILSTFTTNITNNKMVLISIKTQTKKRI